MEGDDEMKLYKLNFILVMMLILTSKILSSTLAMNVTEVSASDTALIYKWNFNVDNETDNFDFGLLDNSVTRFSRGSKSFIFSNGGSDVDIDYSVKMEMLDLLEDINTSKGGNQYVPLVFRISAQEAEVSDKCSTWFTPQGLYDGETENEVKIIEDGRFKKVINESVELNIEWWWNTSYYVGTPSDSEDYYTIAQEDYESKLDSYNEAVDEANAYLSEHSYGTFDDGEGNVTEGFDCDCGANHESEYQDLVEMVESKESLVDNHIKLKYDNYDSKALEYLEDNPVDILFYINGDQVAPGISGD